jgi:TolA-binding protein
MNLVAGVSTTEQQPVSTAQTEALNPINAEVSTSPIERRGPPLWPFAVAFVLFAAAGTAAVFVLRTGREEPHVVEQASAQAPPAKTTAAPPEPTPAETAAPVATPSATTKPIEVASVAKTAMTVKATASAKPSVEAPAPTQSAYDRAKQLMNDGDLDAAEREARAAVATHGTGARLLLGEILERKGKPGLARDVYKKILETDPNNATAKTRLAKLGG